MTVCKDVTGRSNASGKKSFHGTPSRLRPLADWPATRWLGNGRSVFGVPGLPVVLLLVLCSLLASGCQSDPSAQVKIDQMRAEILALEGRYAALRNDYEKVRRRLAAKGDPLAEQAAQPSALPLVYPPGATPLDSPEYPSAWDETGQHPGMQTPPPAPVPQTAPNGQGTSPDSVLEESDGVHLQAPGDARAVAAYPAAARTLAIAPPGSAVASLQIDRQQSHGINRDQLPGDDAIRLLVQPLDSHGRLVLNPTDMELTLSDYSRAGNTRLGRWRFSRQVIQGFLQGRSTPNGIPLQVSVDSHRFGSNEVMAELSVRSPQGEELLVREIISVEPAQLRSDRQAFSLEQLPLPSGTQGLADLHYDLPPSANGPEVVPTYLPRGGSTAPSFNGAGETPAGETTASPGWSPNRE